jgi:hypothetical protein
MAIVLLGALHGLNPGMGWLFAAALGMQEGKGSAAWRALPPLALGHALAVALFLLGALALGVVLTGAPLQKGVGLVLVGYGLFLFVRRRHPAGSGMGMGAGELTLWSFLMATAHGAGLMVVPFFVALGKGAKVGVAQAAGEGAHAGHVHGAPTAAPLPEGYAAGDVLTGMDGGVVAASLGSPELGEALFAVLLHTASYLFVTGLVAVLVASWLGLRLLRTLWVDLDRIWAGALVLTGLLCWVL